MAHTEAHDPTKEISYFAKRSGLYMAGKGAAETIGETVAHSNLLGLSTFLGGSTAGLVMVGLAAGVSATLTQMDYVHRKDNITEMYKEEIAARQHKPINKVTRNDLDTLAQENRVIGEELKQIRKQRTFGVGLSFLASMAALSVVDIALPAVVASVTGALTGAAAMEGLGMIGAIALKAVTGLITYNIVKEPLHHVADKLFHLDYNTTHDHIVSLKKDREAGRAITREQVLSVYAASNPALDKMIVREYGKHFDSLSPDVKNKAAYDIGKLIPLEKLANDINLGKINVTELAFAVDGQTSGVENGRPPEGKKGLMQTMFDSVKNTFKVKATVSHNGHQDRINALAQTETVHTHSEEQQQTGGHVQRLGRGASVEMAHVDRLEQKRAELPLTQQV